MNSVDAGLLDDDSNPTVILDGHNTCLSEVCERTMSLA